MRMRMGMGLARFASTARVNTGWRRAAASMGGVVATGAAVALAAAAAAAASNSNDNVLVGASPLVVVSAAAEQQTPLAVAQEAENMYGSNPKVRVCVFACLLVSVCECV